MLMYGILLLLVGLYGATLSIVNMLAMRSYAPKSQEIITDGPMISVLIPARNEETSLPATLEAMIVQNYKNFEVLVCDDNSTDGTWEVISRYAQMDKRIRGIQGRPLVDGWRGKVFAMEQMLHQAKGEIVLITDADIHHAPNSLSYGYSALIKNKADMVSGYARESVRSLWTQVLISASLFITVFYVLLPLQRKFSKPFFAMAIGQYLMVRTSVLRSMGGFSCMKHVVTDDIELAKQVVKHGYKQQFLDLNPILRVTMYEQFSDAFTGISRSVYHLTGQRSPLIFLFVVLALFLLGTSLFVSFCIFIYQMIALGNPSLSVLLALTGSVLLYLGWIASALFHNYRLSTALLGHFVFILVGWAYLYGMYLKISKRGMVWRGRPLT